MKGKGLMSEVSGPFAHLWAKFKRRPGLFISLFLLKWIVVYFVFMTPHGTYSNSSNNVIASKGDGARLQQQLAPIVVTSPAPLRPFATIATDLGDIELEMFPEDAPKTVANFMKLAEIGFFNKTTLYRYEANFVLQGGGWPTKASPLPVVPLEYKVPNFQFHVSTARTADPDSATCEYSIMLQDNSKWLGPGGSDKYGYAVFAKVVGGFDVIEKFAALKTKKGGLTLLDPAVIVRAWIPHWK